MKDQKGVTLIFLVVTVIILILLAGLTITSSIELYKKMKYENYLAQLEQIQGAVDKVCEKYKTGKYTSYNNETDGYFKDVYGEIPGTLSVANNADMSEKIIENYFGGNSNFHEGYVFYFSSAELDRFFNLNGIEFDVVIDFSTREVYSVKGCSDYDSDVVIYTLSDLKETKVEHSEESLASDATGITFTQVRHTSGTTDMYKITLVLNYEDDGGKYNINKAYYSVDGGTNWLDVKHLKDCEYADDSVVFYIYESGTYYFKIEDTSGKVVTNLEGSVDSVYTTINF